MVRLWRGERGGLKRAFSRVGGVVLGDHVEA